MVFELWLRGWVEPGPLFGALRTLAVTTIRCRSFPASLGSEVLIIGGGYRLRLYYH